MSSFRFLFALVVLSSFWLPQARAEFRKPIPFGSGRVSPTFGIEPTKKVPSKQEVAQSMALLETLKKLQYDGSKKLRELTMSAQPQTSNRKSRKALKIKDYPLLENKDLVPAAFRKQFVTAFDEISKNPQALQGYQALIKNAVQLSLRTQRTFPFAEYFNRALQSEVDKFNRLNKKFGFPELIHDSKNEARRKTFLAVQENDWEDAWYHVEKLRELNEFHQRLTPEPAQKNYQHRCNPRSSH